MDSQEQAERKSDIRVVNIPEKLEALDSVLDDAFDKLVDLKVVNEDPFLGRNVSIMFTDLEGILFRLRECTKVLNAIQPE